MSKNTLCPCGTQREYSACCQPLHLNQQTARTAIQLMRSRYSAFVMHNEEYLEQTLHPQKRKARSSNSGQVPDFKWNGLEILNTSNGQTDDKVGKVEFKAWYFWQGEQECLHEHSRFKKFKGHWYYWDGKLY